MKEMLIVGRGGEGVVLASQILADTLSRAGYWVQSFPEFKAERRGAPISAFLRWDETSPIHRRYKVRESDVLVVVTPSPPSPEVMATIRPGGLVVLNREERFPRTGPFEIARVPGSRIARDEGILSSEGRPMGNVAVLGAVVRLLLPDGLPFLEQAIAARMGSLAEANIAAAREGYRRCTRQHRLAGDTRVETADAGTPAPPARPAYPITTTDSLHLHTGAWSLDRPVLRDACTACALCVLFCPEGAITRSDGSMTIDYLYCKGCGICEVVCPVRNAIEMEEVPA
jgi:2-oxoacid:acceptor oxidoreductase gamma subunit (pyruvate/2-ketoisovalerate family)/2-oxoacid:acceptor oxidoreductase delta subunit (pyruvate/2-ketoisovalerate family)